MKCRINKACHRYQEQEVIHITSCRSAADTVDLNERFINDVSSLATQLEPNLQPRAEADIWHTKAAAATNFENKWMYMLTELAIRGCFQLAHSFLSRRDAEQL
eukprot:5437566-Karenia_brevis.AAC.1